MNPKRWLPRHPLFGSPVCVYCGGIATTRDHTPPRAFLPRKLPQNVNLMTVPACAACNAGFAADETRAAAIITTVSFTAADRVATAPGGWLHSAKSGDRALARFIEDRIGADARFMPDDEAMRVLSRILIKTVVGLVFFEYGRIIPRGQLEVVGIEHSRNTIPDAFLEANRHVGVGWAEVTPSGRELERQVLAAFGLPPKVATTWTEYVPEFFAYIFIKRSDQTLLCGVRLHDALTALVRCPWPAAAGPLRTGKPGMARSSRKRQ